MKLGPFASRGKWFRGNCHTHTTVSDGKMTPEKIVRAYRSRGYDFIVLTDHSTCQPSVVPYQRPGLLVINGIELHPRPKTRSPGPHHIIGIGVDRNPPRDFRTHGSAQDAIRWIRRCGGIPIYGHPYWMGHNTDHMKEGREAFGMEVFNATCEAVGLGDSSAHFDQALSAGRNWLPFAVDDTHVLERDGFQGWIMVKACALTRRAILDAIRAGSFYATRGPTIKDLSYRRGRFHLACSPVQRIVWHAEGPWGKKTTAGKSLLEGDTFDLKPALGMSRYLRVEIADAAGRKAWTAPVFLTRRGLSRKLGG